MTKINYGRPEEFLQRFTCVNEDQNIVNCCLNNQDNNQDSDQDHNQDSNQNSNHQINIQDTTQSCTQQYQHINDAFTRTESNV